jgi:hypothetical protein
MEHTIFDNQRPHRHRIVAGRAGFVFKEPGQRSGYFEHLPIPVPMIRDFLQGAFCNKAPILRYPQEEERENNPVRGSRNPPTSQGEVIPCETPGKLFAPAGEIVEERGSPGTRCTSVFLWIFRSRTRH